MSIRKLFLKDTETKPYWRERILGGAYFNEGVCHVNHNSLQFTATCSILVCTIMRQPSQFLISIGSKIIQHNKRQAGFKGVWTKAPFNGGFAFAWLSTKLSARLQRPDVFMNRPAIKYQKLKRAIQARVSRPSKIRLEIPSQSSKLLI